MALGCVSTRKRMYAKASFDARQSTGQSVRCHIAPLDVREPSVFSPAAGHIQVLERMF